VPDLELLENRRSIAEFADGTNVRGGLMPEDQLLVLAESADAVVDLPRRHGAAASRRTFEDSHTPHFLTRKDVPLLFHVLQVAIRRIVRILFEIGNEIADLRNFSKRLEERSVPMMRSLDHIVVHFDDVRGRRQPHRIRICVRSNICFMVDDLDPRVLDT
jgi:hypothetical protein